MAYQLPVVGTVESGGVRFLVRALPWGLARAAARPGADNAALSEAVYERCVEVEGGDKPPVDDLPADLVSRFVEVASGAKAEGPHADPPSPTNSTAPASAG